MLRQLIAAVAVVSVGTLSAPVGSAAEQPNQDPSVTEKKESAVDRMGRAANNAAKELSDSWITLMTKLNLLADDRVNSTDVHVTTKQRVVALRGTVGSEGARTAAEEDVRKVEGVNGVENHLVVSKLVPTVGE